MRKFAPIFSAIIILALPLAALAAGGPAKEMKFDEHTKTIVISQAINLAILLVVLVSLSRKSIAAYFATKKSNYLAEAEKTKIAMQKAQAEIAELKSRLQKLEQTADESIARAKTEAESIKTKLIAEAEETSRRIKAESRSAIAVEANRARAEIRKELIAEATEIAKQQLVGKISTEDHQRLQGDFLSNIQGAYK